MNRSENGGKKLDCRSILKEEMIEFYNSLVRGHDREEDVKLAPNILPWKTENDYNTDRNSVADVNG